MEPEPPASSRTRPHPPSLQDTIPGVWNAFTALQRAAVAEGALSSRVKELIALAIAVGKQCDGCIAHHARAAARQGASAEEVAEAVGVALLMDGGPASVYGPRAMKAYLQSVELEGHAER